MTETRTDAGAAWTPNGSLLPRELPVLALLVDDQPIVGEAVRHQLAADPGISLHYCQDHEETLPLVRQLRPTVVLLDLVLPGVDGLDVLRSLRADPETRDVPVVVLSNREEAETKAEAFAAGANDYLVKLPDPVETIARVRYHSAAHLARLQRDEAYRALAESQRKLEEANFELRRLVDVDGLTGLANRRHLDSTLAAEWARGTRERSSLSLVMVDIDFFKGFNDGSGHLAGDDCLQAVSRVLAASARRPADLAGRYGGEEFLLLLPRTPLEGAVERAETVREAVEALRIPHGSSSVSRVVTVSAGVASRVPAAAEPPSSLLAEADRALYAAKREGRNRVVAWRPAEGLTAS